MYFLYALIPLAPLLAALWIALAWLAGRRAGDAAERATARVALTAGGLSLGLALTADFLALIHGPPGQLPLGPWLAVGRVQANLSLTLDPLGLAMATLVAFLALVTLRFAVPYLHREAGFQRFFLVLCLFAGAMQLIVTGGNALLVFAGWELAGVSSYLLIAYAYQRPRATRNATRALVTNRIGDAGFLLALCLALAWAGTLEWPALATALPGLGPLPAGLILLGFLVAALAKSALLPFSGWIAGALEGPTPSSAVFYGALLVHAGVYLLIRLEPLLEAVPALLPPLALLGLLTALYGWLTGLTRTDVKSSLLFATTTQVGLMVLACGLGLFQLAAWHLALHALWRAYQFLHAPDLLYQLPEPVAPAPAWLRGRRRLYAAALHRFWLDPVADHLLVEPTRRLARDLRACDERILSRIAGHPLTAVPDPLTLTRARGLPGQAMARLAELLHWFEEHLVLHGDGRGPFPALRQLGDYLERIDGLLAQPRYLLLLIMATLVMIL
jgi:NADH:ubiquinone oxidoreductase subunit 5 (subunit L)/multisubunit Na+/H+ antiporter MnhA subunit